jgi:histidyl-tRNA synthetase
MGVEAIGSSDPSLDAETIHLFISYLDELGLTGLNLSINSMGCKEDRSVFSKELRKFLKGTQICNTCSQRIDMNPLRVFDCKVESCKTSLKDAPKLLEYVCERCSKHFESVQTYLNELSVEYIINPNLVRGFDYYTKTTFEVSAPLLGAQDALGGGGRYDYLIEDYGGPKTPAIGFAFGLERIELALQKQNISASEHIPLKAFMIYYNEEAKKIAFNAMSKLREVGLPVDMDFESKSFKAQIKQADKKNVPYTIIIGPDEINKKIFILRNMKTGEQAEYDLKQISEELKKGNGK